MRPRSILRRWIAALVVLITLAAALLLETRGQAGHRAVAHDRAPNPNSATHPVRSAADPSGVRAEPNRKGSVAASGDLKPGSHPGVLPGPILIADRDNNRLLEVSPEGRVLWRFPEPGDLAAGQSFLLPDDAFYAADGNRIVVTQEDDFVVSVIDRVDSRIVYRYGHPGVPGSEPDYVHNPDDAMLTPAGKLVMADIKNCRILVVRPPSHQPLRQLGITGDCEHDPGVAYGSPNGAFPMSNGDTAVTEINGDWLDVVGPGGESITATNPPGFSYPSDTNEVRPGVFLSADYTKPGALETFTASGKLLWRYEPAGKEALDQPSLALPLPNGDILANDDKNDRVIVVDPHTNRVVWQYGHTHEPGSGEGFLRNPDGVDLAPPYSLAQRFRANMRAP